MKPPVRPGLDHRLRHLVSIVTLATLGRRSELERYLRVALGAGLSEAEVAEALLQVALLAGYPRAIAALDGFARARAAVALSGDAPGSASGRGESRPKAAAPAGETADPELFSGQDPATLLARGEKAFETVYGPDARAVLARLARLHPLLADWVVANAYGFILSRPLLSLRVRECLSVAALSALSAREPLSLHLAGAVRAGATPAELREVLSQSSLYLEESQVEEAMRLLDHVERHPSP